MSIVLVNSDNTVNYIGEKLEDWLNLDEVTVVYDERDAISIQNDVRPVDAVWFWKDGIVLSDKEHPSLVGEDKQQDYKKAYLHEQKS